jgi:uncharacterized membrane protein
MSNDTPATENPKAPVTMRTRIRDHAITAVVLGVAIGLFISSGRYQKIIDSDNPLTSVLRILLPLAIGGMIIRLSKRRFPRLEVNVVLFGFLAGVIGLVIWLFR